jgi:hypothetical protein
MATADHSAPISLSLAWKKCETSRVKVGIGEDYFQALHLHDEHMRVVGPDVILDQQPVAVARWPPYQDRG